MSQFVGSRWTLVVWCLVAAAFAAAACNDGNETPETPTAPAPPQSVVTPQSLLRAATFTDDAPTVDVAIGGNVVFRSIHYPGVSEYTNLNSGAHQIQFLRAGTTRVLAETTVNLGVGEQLTVAVLGFEVDIQVIRDNLSGDAARKNMWEAICQCTWTRSFI